MFLKSTKHYRNRSGKLHLITERMFGNSRDDGRGDIVKIISGVSIVYENDVETPSEGVSNCCVYTRLGQQSRYGNPYHPCVCEIILKLSTLEAVVLRFEQDELTRALAPP